MVVEGTADAVPAGGRALRRRTVLPGAAVLLLVPLILALLLYLVINVFGKPIQINGDSMYPALHHGDRVLLVRYYFGRTPSRGDIVSLKGVTDEPSESIIKRVVGVGGDVITCQGDYLFVNGRQAYRNVLHVCRAYSETVPAGTVYVLGDNEEVSYDSRILGPVPVENVVGRAVLVFWPPDRFTTL